MGDRAMIARPRMADWWLVKPKQRDWWLVQPGAATGRTWSGGGEQHGCVCDVGMLSGGAQTPGLAGYRGCWVCGDTGHRAAECSAGQAAQVESWMVGEIVKHGREWTQVQVQQMIARAELRAQVQAQKQEQQQRSWAQVAQRQTGAGQAPAVAVARRPRTQEECRRQPGMQ